MKVSFDDICKDAELVIVKDNPGDKYSGIHNALICSIPEHPFIKDCIDKCCENIKNKYYGENHLDVTGPTMLGKVFNCYFEKKCEYKNKDLMDIGNIFKKNTKIIVYSLAAGSKITDNNNNSILDTKFENYHNIMYSKSKKYPELWLKKEVYL
jgi:hypothetical protein